MVIQALIAQQQHRHQSKELIDYQFTRMIDLSVFNLINISITTRDIKFHKNNQRLLIKVINS